MKLQQFLTHHNLSDNPFSQEDAREDKIFKNGCVDHTFHPAWDKIIGDPEAPSSAVVFGEKGSGKTALRIQMVEYLKKLGEKKPDSKVLIVEYDDFNPFLDQFLQKEPSLAKWELRDHMDSILSLGVRKVVDMILSRPPEITRQQLSALDRLQKRDLLMLAAMYDRSYDTTLGHRWSRLRRALRYGWPFGGIYTHKYLFLGLLGTAAIVAAVTYLQLWEHVIDHWWAVLIVVALLGAVWYRWIREWIWAHNLAHTIDSSVRVLSHLIPDLRKILLRFRRSDLDGQPICDLQSSDARYVLLNKLQAVLRKFGYRAIVVIVDRVDEPHKVSGNPATMHQVMRSIFDLKFLQHPEVGIKLLLPGELYPYIQSEKQDFRDRARLDKQKFIPSLVWTGQSLEDLLNDRLRACASDGAPKTKLRDLLDDQISDTEVTTYLEQLKIPRHVFKFMYQLFTTHCNNHTEENPEWKISRETFMTTKAVFNQNLQRYEQGLIMG
jgi:hypothetical protein